MVRRCDTCRYWDASLTDCQCCGECRESSPYCELSVAENGEDTVMRGVWPITREDEWCGKWRERYVADGTSDEGER